MKYFNYRWYGYDLLVGCQKCGDKIPFQGIQGNPQCGDCGHVMKFTWAEVLKEADIEDLKKQGKEANSSTIMGSVNLNLSTTWVEGIPCQHCKQTMLVKADTRPEDITCNHCGKPSPAADNEQLKGMVFYKSGRSNAGHTGAVDMVAVRCASCGAPLKADPTKTNYHCQFCNTENILPPSMRRKVVLDDMFVGVQVARLPADQALTANNPEHLKRILRENKKSDYTDEQLNAMVLKFPDDLGVLNQVRYEYKHAVPTHVYEQLWNTTRNFPMLAETGRALKKDFTEIEKKSEGMQNKPQKQVAAKSKSEKTGSKKNKKYIVIAIIVALALYFGWQALRYNGVL